MQLGVTGDRISYGHTIKKSRDIRYFFDEGIRMFATEEPAWVNPIIAEISLWERPPGRDSRLRRLLGPAPMAENTRPAATASTPYRYECRVHSVLKPPLSCRVLVLIVAAPTDYRDQKSGRHPHQGGGAGKSCSNGMGGQ
jgi:hypothetical protein